MPSQILRRALMVAGTGFVLRKLWQRVNEDDLTGQVVLITGSSRGLGLLLAQEFARKGCRIVLCARDEEELNRAKEHLEQQKADVLVEVCDVSNHEQVDRMIRHAIEHFGRLDILVNNAGVIAVGPMQTLTVADFEQAMDVMFWGMVYPTLAVLPYMKERHRGRIVNITSVGGKVSVPHLMPYSAAKFAATGFSEGLRAELACEGVQVTTIIPGLMRTGSFMNAQFKGQHDKEFAWFAISDNLPFLSMDAEQAAGEIVGAVRRNEAEYILTLPAQMLVRFNGLFPGLTSNIMAMADQLVLPQNTNASTNALRGMHIDARQPPSRLLRLLKWGYEAAERFNQYPGYVPESERATFRIEDYEP